jgi:hypothetical protein
MKSLLRSGVCMCVLSIFSCLSPRLGFPVKEIETPVEVSLFSTIAKRGTVNISMDKISGELWKVLYQGKFQEMLDKISTDFYQIKINEAFLDEARITNELFILNPDDVLNLKIEYGKKPDDLKDYSGFDFSVDKSSLHASYVLALTVDEWGYLVNTKKEEAGPYMKFAMQLIDKETNKSLWEYRETFRIPIISSLRDTGFGIIKQADIEEMFNKIIPKAVKQFFGRLRAK